jgi:tRNA(Ile)-lysidine synthase TilS/MesJ
VALSGGKDSLTLLRMLLQIKVRKREEKGGSRREEGRKERE